MTRVALPYVYALLLSLVIPLCTTLEELQQHVTRVLRVVDNIISGVVRFSILERNKRYASTTRDVLKRNCIASAFEVELSKISRRFFEQLPRVRLARVKMAVGVESENQDTKA